MSKHKDTTKKGYALITGATSGIGYELAKCIADDGYNLVIVARTNEMLRDVAAELTRDYGAVVHTISKDLMVPGAAKEIYDEVKTHVGDIEILVNDAGQGIWGKYTETDLDREIDLVHLNIIAVMSLTKYFLRDMVVRGNGKILQLASSLSKAPSPYMAVYAATKAFVYSFTQALFHELKGTGVTITALQPGATDTDFFHKAESEDSHVYKETSLYSPEEVAKAGYDGLLAGKDKVVPGLKNKIQGIMGNLMPDTMVAANMAKQMEPSDKTDGKDDIGHEASAREREQISSGSGKEDGDLEQHKGHVHEDNSAH